MAGKFDPPTVSLGLIHPLLMFNSHGSPTCSLAVRIHYNHQVPLTPPLCVQVVRVSVAELHHLMDTGGLVLPQLMTTKLSLEFLTARGLPC